jgi:predicted HTH transcriptional regulator
MLLPIFQGRFKSILVQNDAYLMQLSYYIHRNPFLDKASKVLQCDLERIKNCVRISESDKLNRDILLYWLWQEGKYTNQQIGELFGLTHSAVSRRVTIIRKRMAMEQNFQSKLDAIKSQIKP